MDKSNHRLLVGIIKKTKAESIEISTLSKICKTMNIYNPKIPVQSGNRGGNNR